MPHKSSHARSNVIPLVLYYIDDEYRKSHSDVLRKIDDDKALWIRAAGIAKKNGLLYYFFKRAMMREEVFSAKILKTITKDEEVKHSRFRDTLNFVTSLFSDEELNYMFIKLYRGVPYTPRDVDVLIKKAENSRVMSAFKRRNAALRVFDDAEVNFEKEGLLKVDLYNGFYYFSRNFSDEGFLWRNSRKVEICGVECPIPSYEADFASLLIHSILAHRCLSLLDFLYAKSLLFNKRLDLNEIAQQAEKYKWEYACSAMIDVIRDIYRKLFIDNQPVDFPVMFHPRFTLRFFKLDSRKKFTFVASSLVDRALYRYEALQNSTQIELPPRFHNFMLKAIRKVKHWVGDRKGIDAVRIVD